MSTPTPSAKKTRLPVWAQIILTIFSCCIVVILVLLFGPREGDTDNVSGDYAATPTVGITNIVETNTLNHQFDFRGVQISLTTVTLASKFTDDRKLVGTYTLRVLADTKNPGQDVIGIDYTSVVHLILPSGAVVPIKLVSIKPAQLPGVVQTGFFDFPLDSKIPLSQLHMRFDTVDIPLAG
jgi:hypothetical protein